MKNVDYGTIKGINQLYGKRINGQLKRFQIFLKYKFCYNFLKRVELFIFREREREGERGREKHQYVVASRIPLTGDLARNPGMCPDWESNQ